ncbi:hypothetical protein [Peribacillus sp. SCS-37]|uniref:hypothetical protein n=1 Tax=Paraperibacillus esterisolvens TaxID=3115296 RepID=UPI003905BCEE
MEVLAAASYRALYITAAAFSRSGINSVIDTGHHGGYSVPLGLLTECAEIVEGLPVMPAVNCSIGNNGKRECHMEKRLQ